MIIEHNKWYDDMFEHKVECIYYEVIGYDEKNKKIDIYFLWLHPKTNNAEETKEEIRNICANFENNGIALLKVRLLLGQFIHKYDKDNICHILVPDTYSYIPLED